MRNILFLKRPQVRNSPCSPVVRTPCFHCWIPQAAQRGQSGEKEVRKGVVVRTIFFKSANVIKDRKIVEMLQIK